MKRLAALCCAVLLFAGGCLGPESVTGPPVEEDNSDDTGIVPDEIVFLVDVSMDPVYLEAAEHFAQLTNRLTGGELEIQVRSVMGAGVRFGVGNGQLTFLDSQGDRELCSAFGPVSMSFLYTDYHSFTVTANDRQVLSMVEANMRESIHAKPLAAFYQPGSHIVSTFPATDSAAFNGSFMAVEEGRGSKMGLELLGGRVVELEPGEERVDWLKRGMVQVIELPLEEIAAADWTESNLYYTLTYHNISPVWLGVKGDFYDNLPLRYQVALEEATAYLFHDIDDHYLALEQGFLEEIERMDLLYSDDMNRARDMIFEALISFPEGLLEERELFMLQKAREIR